MFAIAKSADLSSSDDGARHFRQIWRRASVFLRACQKGDQSSVAANRTVAAALALHFAFRRMANTASDAAERRVASMRSMPPEDFFCRDTNGENPVMPYRVDYRPRD
jgi:hypothetical protein